MSYLFYLKHKDRDGTVKQSAIVTALSIQYRRVVNKPGNLTFVLNNDDTAVSNFAEFDQVEVLWKNDEIGVDWHVDFEAIFRDEDVSTDQDGIDTFTAGCPGQMEILGYRQIGWAGGIDNRSLFEGVPAETLMKTLVEYNCGASATALNGRIRDGDLALGMGMTVTTAADLGRGDTLTKYFSQGNLLRALSEDLADIAGGDFALNKIGDAAWEFEFYPGQLGQDKSTGTDKVEFSLPKGNLLVPSLSKRRTKVKTVALVGSTGKMDKKTFTVLTGPDYAADRDIEMTVGAGNAGSADGATSTGNAALEQRRELKDFSFRVLQTSNVFYSPVAVTGKKTYDLGDLVSIVYNDAEFVRKIIAVEVSVRYTDGEAPIVSINIDTEDVN